MGRRSINTTKSGKYMNPTDQARKEARKKELKKNKRQRQMVRAAVLKNKDPGQILEEMEKIDEMEYNVMQPSPLNEKVLRDKRKKLKETFDRVMRLYHTEEPEHWAELKRKEVEYEKKRLKKQQYYESVKHAQSVQIDEIPLPSASQATANTTNLPIGLSNRLPPPPTALSLPPFAPSAPPGTLRKTTEVPQKPVDKTPELKKKELPGVPPGPPPDLFELPELDTDAEDDEVVLKEYIVKSKPKSKAVNKPNSLQQRMLAISGQNIDEFMKEMESVHRKKEKERAAVQNRSDKKTSSDNDEDKHKSKGDLDKLSAESDTDSDSGAGDESDDSETINPQKNSNEMQETKIASTTPIAATPAATTMPVPLSAAIPTQHNVHPPAMSIPGPPMPPVAGMPPSMIFRPPPLRPPGMPTFGMRMPPGPPAGIPARLGIRMPPGPPPGLPPRHHHKGPPPQHQHKDLSKGVTTITAKPQIRNLSADVTRFVPSTLRVKREDGRKHSKSSRSYSQSAGQSNQSMDANKTATKDDAYLQFMNEMQGLL